MSAHVLLIAVAVLMAACTQPGDSSRAAAEAFLDAHYVRIDLETSMGLCDGLARSKVEQEIALTRGIEIGEDTQQPRVNYQLERVREDPGQAHFGYELTVRVSGLEPFKRLVTIIVREVDGRWTVTNYNDGERAGASAP